MVQRKNDTEGEVLLANPPGDAPAGGTLDVAGPAPAPGAANALCNEACLFRSSDDVRQGFVRRLGKAEARPITYNVIDDVAIFEGDIALGSADAVESLARTVADEGSPEGLLITTPDSDIQEAVAIPGMRFRWPGGVMPYTVVPALRNVVNQAIAHIQANTRIRFVERTNANQGQYPNFVAFEQQNGCWSSVGMQGGRQVISLGPGCEAMGIAVHEICHALGLWHEQSREDRENNVRINWANIQPGQEHNFNQHITDGDDIGNYDFGSIMHYGRRAFSRNNQDTIVPINGQAIGQRNGMSAGDIAAIRALYPELEPSANWRGTQFTGTVAAGATQTWFTHSWPSHWFVLWNTVPTAPVVDGPAQIELRVRTSRQADRANARLVKYHLSVRNLTNTPVTFEARYEVLGWSPSFI